MLTAVVLVAAIAVSGLVSGPLAQGPSSGGFYGDDDGDPGDGEGTSAPEVDASSEDGSVAVRIEVAGSTVEGAPFVSSSVAWVAPRCWHTSGWTGYAYYEYWKDGGEARNQLTLDAFAAQGLLNPNFADYATETAGAWWEPTCRDDVPVEELLAYRRDHPAVYVFPGDPVPADPVVVDPEVLAQVAYEAMDLPVGQVQWNPQLPGSGATVVNTDTWVWVADAPVTVAVTASVAGQWARVDAQLAELNVSAPGADAVSCPDAGTPWTQAASGTSCAIVFFRSSANQPVKAGWTVPTATMTVTARWEAAWVSSADATPTELPDQEMVTTAEVPVAEIQAIVTRG